MIVVFYRERDDPDGDSITNVNWDLGTVRGPDGFTRLLLNEDDNRKHVQNGEPPKRDLPEVRYISYITYNFHCS